MTLHSTAEWLEADGLGGFASGTVAGPRTRRYHALLLAAKEPPTGRIVLVNGVDAFVTTPSGRFAITSQRYAPDLSSPDGEIRLQYFEAEHQRHPDDIKTISLIGNLYSKIGDLDKAIEWFQKRLDLEPDNPEALYTLGVNCWARSYNHMDLDLEQRF